MENGVPKKLKIESPYEPATSLLGIYPKELKAGSRRDICPLMFITALFTVAKRWKNTCVYGQMDKGNMVYTYGGILCSIEKEGNLSYATIWMNYEDVILS